MKVGDIGEIVYSTGFRPEVVGMTAEIIEEISHNEWRVKIYFLINVLGDIEWPIWKDQIRPISNPDQEQSIEEKKELVKQRG